MTIAAPTSKDFPKAFFGGQHEPFPSEEYGNSLRDDPRPHHIEWVGKDASAMSDRISKLEVNAAVVNERFATIAAKISATEDKMDAHMRVIEAKFDTIMKSHNHTDSAITRMDQRLGGLEATVNTMSGTLKAMPGWGGLLAVAAALFALISIVVSLK